MIRTCGGEVLAQRRTGSSSHSTFIRTPSDRIADLEETFNRLSSRTGKRI
jgi:hypothetical protein